MGAKNDHMMKAVQPYPCPWCSERSGYSAGAANLSDVLNLSARSIASWVKPVRAVEILFSPGMAAACRNCGRTIGICGHCDHPNRGVGMNLVCQNCGKTYRPG
jgi:hypothetical protein